MRFDTSDIARICGIMFQTATEGVVIVDTAGIIRFKNPRLAALFGYSSNELLDQPIEVLIPEGVRAGHVHKRDVYIKAPVLRPLRGLELRGQRKDGSVFPAEVSLSHFELDGTGYVMALVMDITARREAEDALRRLNADLERLVEERTADLKQGESKVREALEKERELNEMRSSFVAMASHEFRTPLAAMHGSVDLIDRYAQLGNMERIAHHAKKVRSKIGELTVILNEFLSLEKLERGLSPADATPFDAVALFQQVVEGMQPLTGPGQRIEYRYEQATQPVTLDPQLCSNILTNLLGNAIKYAPMAGPILVYSSLAGGLFRFIVLDQGIGIPKEDHRHLFERFFRASNATVAQGTGLGLHIVHRYIDQMKGSIHLNSEQGKGTCIMVQLPQHLSPDENGTCDRGRQGCP